MPAHAMRIESLRLLSFRAHEDTTVQFSPGVNLIVGPNGAGKTNILEAIHALCLSKSFLTQSDTNIVRRGDALYRLDGTFAGEQRPKLEVRLTFVPGEGKRAIVNKAPLDRLAQIVGTLPVVVLSPDDYVLTSGGPEERRRFLDNTLSQARPTYLDDVLKYRRVLKQRNALLLAERHRATPDRATLEAWTSELVSLGARIIERRRSFVDEFSTYLQDTFEKIEAVGEQPTIEYKTAVDLSDDDLEIAERLQRRYDVALPKERARGRTLIGPHRDELVFRLNGHEVRPYASQGQHRTFALALKLATMDFLKATLDESPILLLDDVFGILDRQRSRVILDMLQSPGAGQCIVTAAGMDPFEGLLALDDPRQRVIEVRNGLVGATRKDLRTEVNA